MVNIINVMKSQKVEILDGLDNKSADEIQKIFNIKSHDEIDAILERTERFHGAIQNLRDDHTDTLANAHFESDAAVNKALKQNIDLINQTREIPDRSIERIVENVYRHKNPNIEYDYMQNKFELNMLNEYMLGNDIVDEGDETVIAGDAHDETLVDLKEELLTALNSRKSKVLKITLAIFNKL
jgi:hypothetical protein